MLSALEASHELGISAKHLRRLEGRSETFIARHDVKGGVALYDKAAISLLRGVLSDSVKLDVCARQLGIPRFCVEPYIAASLVRAVNCLDAEIITRGPLISITSIQELRERLRRKSCNSGRGITLREVMSRNGDPQCWVAVLKKMLSGELQFQMTDCAGRSLSDAVIVEAIELRAGLPRRSTGLGIDGVNISCQIAAGIIGTTPQFISAAIKVGLLAGRVGSQNSALTLEEVLTFQRNYVVAEELREIFGAHQRSVGSRLRGAGLTPVTTISTTTVWLRLAIENFIGEQKHTCRLGELWKLGNVVGPHGA